MRHTRRALQRLGRVVVAACVAGMPLLAPATAHADPLTDLKAKIAQGEQSLKDLTTRRQNQQAVVSELRGVTSASTADLRRVDQDLFVTANRLQAALDNLARVDAETQALETQIAEKQAAVDQRANAYSTRLRALYKFTRTSPLEQLLGAHDFSDALRRVTMMQAVARVDNQLLGGLRAEYAALVSDKAALEAKRQEALALRGEIEQQQSALQEQRTQKAALVATAQQNQLHAEADLSAMERDVQATSAQIAIWQVQHQQELEALERQREEAQRQAAAQATAQAVAQATAQAAAQATALAAKQQAARPASGGAAQPTPVAGRAAPPLANPATALLPSSAGLSWPIARYTVTTEFGESDFAQAFHTGIDLATGGVAPVLAAGDGIVMSSGLAVPGHPAQSYGMMITIAHSKTLSTLYAHLDNQGAPPTVKAGDTIRRGQIIGYVGMTGLTSGYHLHFEVRDTESGRGPGAPGCPTCRNPRSYLPR